MLGEWRTLILKSSTYLNSRGEHDNTQWVFLKILYKVNNIKCTFFRENKHVFQKITKKFENKILYQPEKFI